MLPMPAIVPAKVDPPPSVTYVTRAVSTANASSYNFSVSIPADAQLVVVVAGGNSGANVIVNSITIGGVAGTLTVRSATGLYPAGMFQRANVPAGTATISVAFSGACNNAGIGVWVVRNMKSVTPYATGNLRQGSALSSVNVPISIQKDSAVIGGSHFSGTNGTNSVGPSGMIFNYSINGDTNQSYRGMSGFLASAATAITWNTATSTNTQSSHLAAAWK